MKCALSIAATDTTNGAGLGADLRVFNDLGVYGLGVATCVTAQNSHGVQKIYRVAPRIVSAQIDSIMADFEVSACKVGMVYSPQNIDKIADRIGRREIANVVLDPVISAKDGTMLLTPAALKRMKRNLFRKISLVTPNADEALLLCGISVDSVQSAKEAAKAIIDLGPAAVIVKGGHISGEPVDVFYDGNNFIEYSGKRLPQNMHGTGCVFSAAIAARLALGESMPAAILYAKEYVSRAIAKSVLLGKGKMGFLVTKEARGSETDAADAD